MVSSYDRTPFWKDDYAVTYHAIVAQYADTIAAQLFGHTHSDEFRVEDPARCFRGPGRG